MGANVSKSWSGGPHYTGIETRIQRMDMTEGCVALCCSTAAEESENLPVDVVMFTKPTPRWWFRGVAVQVERYSSRSTGIHFHERATPVSC